jgi:hypothetical protein
MGQLQSSNIVSLRAPEQFQKPVTPVPPNNVMQQHNYINLYQQRLS